MYTVNTGEKNPPRTDIKCYTEDKLGNPHYSSRLYKMLSHIYDPGEWSVYIDSNIFLPDGMEERLIEEVKKSGKDIGVFIHPERDCVYEEADMVLKLGKDTRENLKLSTDFYRSIGFPAHGGLAACGIIVRHHTEEIKRLNERWWAEVCARSKRDQMSFPYVFKDAHYFLSNIGNFFQFKRYRNSRYD